MLACAHPAFDGPVILFQNIIEVLHRSMPAILLQSLLGFKPHDGRRITGMLVGVDANRYGIETHQMVEKSLLSKKRSKKVLTKRPPFLVKSLVCKTSEKTVNGGWRDGRTLKPF
jgi:hypothetical protein